MARLPKNHNSLYFDALCRTQKKETLNALIKATYFSKKNSVNIDEVKADIAKRLQYAYALFRDNVRGYDNGYGSYDGNPSQFESQYTIGHEMAIWKNSNLDLNPLAISVAEDKITIVDYLDKIFLNYIQPINEDTINILYSILVYLRNNNKNTISKDEYEKALNEPTEDGSNNGLYQLLGDTSYFIKQSNDTLMFNSDYDIDEIISRCNITYIGKEGYQRAKIELNSEDAYNNYISGDSYTNYLSEDEIDELIDGYIQYLAIKGFKSGSIYNYRRALRNTLEYCYKNNIFYKKYISEIINSDPHDFNNFIGKEMTLYEFDHNNPNNKLGNGFYIASIKKFNEYLSEADKESKNNIINLNEISHWIIPVNEELFDYSKCFNEYGFIEWHQVFNGKNGDIVYIYESKPGTKIKYKTQIMKTDITYNELEIKDNYWKDENHFDDNNNKYLKLKLLDIINVAELEYNNLREYGILSQLQNPENIDNKEELIEYIENQIKTHLEENRIKGGFNKIYYGVPGCGKSYLVDKVDLKNDVYEKIRTTFHPEYSNSDFVGQLIPKLVRDDENEENHISYEFQKGPFSEALIKAINNPEKKVCLIIEEINRGNASAIFGDIFQLLDRNENGESVFGINNPLLEEYLRIKLDEVGINKLNQDENIKLPSNLWIVATMNTSDQNVFTLDTAFKRRWKMHRVQNEFESTDKIQNMYVPGTDVTWKNFIEVINQKIKNTKSLGVNSEDKQLGTHFVSEEELSDKPFDIDNNQKIEAFAEKVLLYIWDDIAKIKPSEWFNQQTYDDLLKSFYNSKAEKLSVFKLDEDMSFNHEGNKDE